MTTTIVEGDLAGNGIVSLNVRAFRNIDYEKIRIRYVDMKDEEPVYDVDAMPDPEG